MCQQVAVVQKRYALLAAQGTVFVGKQLGVVRRKRFIHGTESCLAIRCQHNPTALERSVLENLATVV